MATGTAQPAVLPPPPPIPSESKERERVIQRQLARTSWQLRLIDLASGIATWFIGVLVLFIVCALIDHFIGLGSIGRCSALAVLVGCSLWYLVVAVGPLLVRAINPEYAARTIEEATPTLKNSLINFLLLRHDRASLKEIVYQAVEKQAAADISGVPVEATVDRSRLIYAGYILCVVLAIFAGYKIVSPKDPFQTVARVLSPWAEIARPSRVQISNVEPGSAEVYYGQSVPIMATVRGARDGDKVMVRYSTADGQTVNRTIEMKLSAGDQYECSLPPAPSSPAEPGGLLQNVTYQIVAGDAETFPFRLTVISAPTIIVDRLDYQYPAYTGKAPESVTQQGDIKALEGTRVTVRAVANQEIKSAWLELDPSATGGPAETAALAAEGERASGTLTLQLRPDRQTPWRATYQVRFYNERGQRSQQPILHKIEVIRDLAPEVQILKPERVRVEVPEDGEETIEVRAVDPDFGLAKLKMEGTANGKQPISIDLLPDSAAQPPQITTAHAFRPREHRLKAGDELRYTAVAEDNRTSPLNGQPEPNITRTKEYTLIVTAARKNERGNGGPNQQQGAGGRDQDQQKGGAPKTDSQRADQKDQKNQPGQQGGEQRSEAQRGEGQGDSRSPQQPGNEKQQDGQKTQEPNQQGGEKGGQKQQSGQEQQANQHQQGNQQQQGSQKQDGQQDGQQKQPQAGDQQGGQSAGDQQKGGQQSGSQQQGGQPSGGQQNGGQQGGAQQAGSQQGGNQQEGNQQGGGQSGERQANQSGAKGAGTQQSNGPPGAGDPNNQPGGQNGQKGQGGQSNGGQQQQAERAAQAGEKGRGEESGKAEHDGQAIERIWNQLKDRLQNKPGKEQQPEGGEKQQPGDKQDGKQPGSDQGGQSQSGGQSGAQNQNVPNAGRPEGNDQKLDPQQQAERGQGKAGDANQRLPDDKEGQNPSQQNSGGNKGGAPRGGSHTDKSEKSSSSKGEQQDAGAAKNGDEGSAQASDDKSGSGMGLRKNQDVKKDPKEDSSKPQQGDPSAASTSNRQSDSKGGESGDQSGGGKKGAGQSGAQEGNDSAGSKSAGDQGAGKANETGSGETGSKAGEQQQAADKTGKRGEQSGEGSQSREGKGTPGAGAKADRGQRDASKAPQKGDPENTQTSDDGRHIAGGKDDGRERFKDKTEAVEEQEADAANLEYARKATDMVLKHLKDEEHNPDPELLEKLGWSKEDLAEFLKRWDALQKSAEQSPDGKRELDEALKSLGLRDPANRRRAGGKVNDNQRDLRDAGNRSAPPPRYRDLFDAFRKGAARSQP